MSFVSHQQKKEKMMQSLKSFNHVKFPRNSVDHTDLLNKKTVGTKSKGSQKLKNETSKVNVLDEQPFEGCYGNKSVTHSSVCDKLTNTISPRKGSVIGCSEQTPRKSTDNFEPKLI